MTALCAAHNRRRRRKLLLPLLILALFAFAALCRAYAEVTINILFRGPYIARRRSAHMHISAEHDDGFDVSFRAYPSTPVPPEAIDASLPVPPLVHHILLGKPKVDPARSANLTAARQACMDMHPGYQFKFWTDAAAAKFVREQFPQLFDMWSGYRMTIQKADSLRYMLLYVHGGIFLDLDLECLRPLDPLRRFDFVAPEATPMGISNGFIMVAPRHPFMKFVIDNLARYNVNWLGIPYPTVMFSTGCHFLSTMLSIFPGRDKLHILWGPNGMHRLSGAVTTPLFRHLGMSSWHSFDGAIWAIFKPDHALSITDRRTYYRVAGFAIMLVGLSVWRRRRRGGRRRKSWDERWGDKDGRLMLTEDV